MRAKLMVLTTFALVLALAPAAFALGGGGGRSRHSGNSAVAFSGTVETRSPAGSTQAGGGSVPLSASEPLGALAVGLGLLGARYLRRR
jgi:hypothetical protein